MGVPYKQGENTNKIVIEVAKLLNVELTQDQISTSHRLQLRKRNNKQNDRTISSVSPIIVRFISRDVRNKIFANRKLARAADVKGFSVEDTENIYVNENLTRAFKSLFWLVKQKAKANGFQFYWMANGSIYAQKSEESNTLSIKSEKDLDLLN